MNWGSNFGECQWREDERLKAYCKDGGPDFCIFPCS